jgi:hypothetical protein
MIKSMYYGHDCAAWRPFSQQYVLLPSAVAAVVPVVLTYCGRYGGGRCTGGGGGRCGFDSAGR